MTSRALAVWMNGLRVGTWSIARGEHRFAYEPSWLASPLRRPLSLSMPLRADGAYSTAVVLPFFDNLLPDNEAIRRRIRDRYRADDASAFELLSHVGRDCIGAVQLLPAGARAPDVTSVRVRPLTAKGVADTLAAVGSPSMGARDVDDFRISLAGAQEKTALVRQGRGWAIPEGTTPTTHIFKLPIAGFPDSIENEWFCLRLLKQLGVPCAEAELGLFGSARALVVERFDRRRSPEGVWMLRLPQEDLCQATGTAPGRKYESDGGPGIAQVLALLSTSRRAEDDRVDFFRTQFLFWLMCAIDGHAKNFSVFLEAGGTFALTPRYDVLSAYPLLGPKQGQIAARKVKLAMAVRGANPHYRWSEIAVRHWYEVARKCGVPQAEAVIRDVLGRAPDAVADVRRRLPKGFPARVSGVIGDGVLAAVTRAQRQA